MLLCGRGERTGGHLGASGLARHFGQPDGLTHDGGREHTHLKRVQRRVLLDGLHFRRVCGSPLSRESRY